MNLYKITFIVGKAPIYISAPDEPSARKVGLKVADLEGVIVQNVVTVASESDNSFITLVQDRHTKEYYAANVEFNILMQQKETAAILRRMKHA